MGLRDLKEDMNIVVVGHVDHGKSTVVGRILADTNSLPMGKLEQIEERCRRNSKPFEYAFLLDALKDEQSQGITIDSARCFFNTLKREYIIIDAPGHIEFLKNMVTGASRAEAALLVIDAYEGVKENSRRHGYMLSMLGIKQVCVLINKMDLVGYSKEVYERIAYEYKDFLEVIGIKAYNFIPISGREGDNIVNISENMLWYEGLTIVETLDSFESEKLPQNKPFRMPVQDIYKFTTNGDSRRIVAGTIESGKLSIGDEVTFYPSGKKSKVNSIESFNEKAKNSVSVGYAAGFTLEEQIYIKRGQIAALSHESKPMVGSRIKTNLFWLGKKPMVKGKEYYFKLGTSKVLANLEEVISNLDSSSLDRVKKDRIETYDVAQCIIKLKNEIAFDLPEDIIGTSRFVIVDDYEIAGGGIVQENLKHSKSIEAESVITRDYQWEKSKISRKDRSNKNNHKPAMILINSENDKLAKVVGMTLEKQLFKEGNHVYYLNVGDLDESNTGDKKLSKEEHIRRFIEVANFMIDAGLIVIIIANNLASSYIELIKTIMCEEEIITVFVYNKIVSNLDWDLNICENDCTENNVLIIKEYLMQNGIVHNEQ